MRSHAPEARPILTSKTPRGLDWPRFRARRSRYSRSGPCAQRLVVEHAPTTRAWNTDGGALESSEETSAVCTTWVLASSTPRGGDICDPELATRIAANEPSPEGRPAGLPPTDPKLSARKSACSTAIFYDRSQADLLILTGTPSSPPAFCQHALAFPFLPDGSLCRSSRLREL